MNDRSNDFPIRLSIAAVERDTGLSKDTLRVWERRYGFPAPERDAIGERAYDIAQVEKLRLVKRLLDAGHRPGRIVPLAIDELQRLAEQTVDQPQKAGAVALGSADLQAAMALLRAHDVPALRAELMRMLGRFGLARFVTEVVAPLNVVLGDAWLRGQVEIFEEHVYVETVQNVLRQAIAAIPQPVHDAAAVRVLLSTFPGEQHGMGLLMVEALLALEGCLCVSLGTQTPVWDIARAAQALRADIVALSFTACLSPGHIVEGLGELRGKLPEHVQLWAGGSAPALHRKSVPGVQAFSSLDDVAPELLRWRQQHPRG